ncbi:MAG: response regulator [Nitrospinae bacterium]|nr:response regulator [Nitrospinota bacterium]
MKKLKLLVAEDKKNYREIYEAVLANSPTFDVKIVGDGKMAVEEYVKWSPDVVVLDIMMPVMSGYLALKEIRQIELNAKRKTTIIMASSMSEKDDIEDCIKAGIQGYILKPFDPDEFCDKVVEYHAKKHA